MRKNILKHNALTTTNPPREIIRTAMSGANRGVMGETGGIYNMAQIVNYTRRNTIDSEQIAINEFNLPVSLLYTIRGNRFYQYGPNIVEIYLNIIMLLYFLIPKLLKNLFMKKLGV